MQSAGFELLVTEDLAESHDALPWWYPISGDVKSAKGFKVWLWLLEIQSGGDLA